MKIPQSVLRAHSWTREHQPLLQLTFWFIFMVVVVIDIYMVKVLHVDSITMRIRDSQDGPGGTTITAFGVLLGVTIAYLLYPVRITFGWVMAILGHLFTGAVFICVFGDFGASLL
jgi:hypothetical protein